jgi:hypothetical protein
VSKSPRIRVSIEFSCKVSRVFQLSPRWIPWILLLVCFVLTHGLGHLPAYPAA